MPPLPPPRPIALRLPLRLPPARRHVSSTSSSPPPKHRPYLRLTVITALAASLGFYIRHTYSPSSSSSSTTLNPYTFTPYTLLSKTPVSSTSSIFTLRPLHDNKANSTVYTTAWHRGLWSVTFKQPQLQIGRDYTPLPPSVSGDGDGDGDDDGALRFLIRKDPYGEVSGYLHNLPPGATVEMRGPQVDYALKGDGVEEVLFIAGGTGIAPAVQAAYVLFREGRGKERMHILWACRRREDCEGGVSDCSAKGGVGGWWRRGFWSWGGGEGGEAGQKQKQNLVVRQLEELKAANPGRLTVDYFVDEEGSLLGRDAVLAFTEGKRMQQSDSDGGEKKKKKVILVSGPDGFVSYLAGPKVWRDGVEAQGPLGGLLGRLDVRGRGWSVWKL
ncbi:mitochondrial peripheral inner membrane protein [Onygenales sp. PD_10]|nr:mitochondrial peripheral inner membrane protein [Onygenales sp. PD_10]